VAVRIRLRRAGRRHLPYYHIGVFDVRQRREAEEVERLGTYDPTNKDEAKQVVVDTDRAAYWLGVGAQPSQTVAALLRRAGAKVPEPKPASARRERPRKERGARSVKERTKKRTANSKARKERKKAEA